MTPRERAQQGCSRPVLLSVAYGQGQSAWAFAPVLGEVEVVMHEDLLVSDECSIALVDEKLCLVVDQDFLCADSGDESKESTKEVVERLKARLLPELERIVGSCPGARASVGYGQHLRRERPTVLVAVPVEGATPELVKKIVGKVLNYAFPS